MARPERFERPTLRCVDKAAVIAPTVLDPPSAGIRDFGPSRVPIRPSVARRCTPRESDPKQRRTLPENTIASHPLPNSAFREADREQEEDKLLIEMVQLPRLERGTPRSTIWCSNQLSYSCPCERGGNLVPPRKDFKPKGERRRRMCAASFSAAARGPRSSPCGPSPRSRSGCGPRRPQCPGTPPRRSRNGGGHGRHSARPLRKATGPNLRP